MAVMWPPVSPNTPLLSMMHVIGFAPGGGVDHLLETLVDHVTVTLDGEHDRRPAGTA